MYVPHNAHAPRARGLTVEACLVYTVGRLGTAEVRDTVLESMFSRVFPW